MKTIVFLGAMAVVPVILAAVLHHLRGGRRFALIGLVMSVTVIIDVNIAADLNYRGMSNALDLGTADIIGFGLLLFLVFDRRRRGVRLLAPDQPPTLSPVVLAPPLTACFLAFIAVNVISLVGAESLWFGLLDVVKLVRGFLMFWIAANLVADDATAEALPLFLSVFVVFEVLAAAKDFVSGVYWVDATFSHKNSFAFAMNIMLPLLLARALVRPRRRLLFLGFYLAGAVVVVISRSRTAWMTMGLSAVLTAGMCVLAAARRGGVQALRRMGTILMTLLALVLPLGLTLADGMISRWGESADASFEFRTVHNDLAVELANTHLFGLGTNNYVMNLAGPMGARMPEIDRTVAHNTYLLIAAETGWIGLACFLAILIAFAVLILRMYRNAKTLRAIYISTGAFAALVASALHSTMESGTMLRRQTYFLWCIFMGLIVSVAQREWQRRPSLTRWANRRRDARFDVPPEGRP